MVVLWSWQHYVILLGDILMYPEQFKIGLVTIGITLIAILKPLLFVMFLNIFMMRKEANMTVLVVL
ncbi:MAG: hypothetical protein EBR82_62885 [Caulobacteraceae bacterium]|nr:hypothetical protein [Caulobacteraceae bacterium]